MSLFGAIDNFLLGPGIFPLIMGAGGSYEPRPSDILWRETVKELKKNGIIKDRATDGHFLWKT